MENNFLEQVILRIYDKIILESCSIPLVNTAIDNTYSLCNEND